MKDMSCSHCPCDGNRPFTLPAEWVADIDGAAYGVARAAAVDCVSMDLLDRWIGSGMHGGMHYMENYRELRGDPRLLLPGARSVVVVAFSYYHSDQCEGNLGRIAAYAHGDDYHDEVRRRLERLAARIAETCGGTTRVCVDTAPLSERYWAVRAGVGFIGRNRMLIVPGGGSYMFIGVVLATALLTASRPCTMHCVGCGRCVDACPAGAITDDGVDARRCLSALTIEHRGEFPAGTDLCGRLYGCDICQRVCPHNNGLADTPIACFHARDSLRELTPEKILDMEQADFSAIMRRSAIKRAKLAGLQRNARLLCRDGKQSHV